MTGTTEATVEGFWERVWNGGEVTAIDELVDPESVLHTSGTPVGPRDVARVGGGVPGTDRRPAVRDRGPVLEREPDRHALAHRGDPAGDVRLPATGEPIPFTGITVFVVEDGRLRESWVERSAYELFLGLRADED